MPDLNAEEFSEAVAKGVGDLERGVTDYSKWSRLMVYQFGEPIRPNLERIWGAAQDEWHRRLAASPFFPTVGPHEPTPEKESPNRVRKTPKPALLRVSVWIAAILLTGVWLWWGERAAQKGPTEAPTGVNPAMLEPIEQNDVFDLLANAEKGDAEAQTKLGKDYYWEKNYTEAVKWFRKAADQGDAEAQCNLAVCYALGQGVSQDHAEAAKWYRRAAEQGVALAQYQLALCCYQGQGVPKNDLEAFKWLSKAAEAGVPYAEFIIGTYYRNGKIVQLDYSKAAKWHWKAAVQGVAGAQVELGKLYSLGLGVPKDQRRAAELFRRAADQGYADGQSFLADCYWRGDGVPQDFTEAYKWWDLAAAQGNELARRGRDLLMQDMTPQQVNEAQSQASAFVAKTERVGPGPDDFLPRPGNGERQMSAGTGFFVTDDGYLVTCEHVVRGATSFHVKTPAGSIPARLVKQDRALDVALLKTTGTFQALPVGSEPRVRLGDSVFTVGFPNPDVQGVEPKLTRGEISSLAGVRDNPRYFQISVPVQPGNSGGALVDEGGNVVGVVTARLDDVTTLEISGALPQNVNYAVKGALVRDFLNRVPGLSGKLKAPRTTKDREAANTAAERAAVLVTAE